MEPGARLLAAPVAAAAFALALLPLMAAVMLGSHGLLRLAADLVWAAACVRSLMLSELTVAVALPFGVAAALALWGAPLPFRRLMLGLASLALLLPPVWLAAGLAWTAAKAGLGAAHLAMLTIGHAAGAAALVLLVMTARLNRVDPLILRAAKLAGASSYRIWLNVLLPQIAWELLISAAACIAFSLGQAVLDDRLQAASHPTLDALALAASALGGGAAAPASLLLTLLAASPLAALAIAGLFRLKIRQTGIRIENRSGG